jgi:hypothetical protein
MITMVRNGKKIKVTKKQFRNYWLNVQLKKDAKENKDKGK